jgi:hypothetical protein
MKLIKIILIAAISYPNILLAYEIGKKSLDDVTSPDFNTDKIAALEWEKNHEKLTALSLQCLADQNKGLSNLNNKPINCSRRVVKTEEMSLFNGSDQYPKSLDKYRLLIKTVRWPDDPTRQVYEESDTAVKFAGTMKATCKLRISNSDDNEIDLAADGLLCAGHYGRFQFIHSMAISDNIRAEDTYNKIIDWSKFAYLFSLEEIGHSEKYCEYWSKNAEYPHIKNAFQVQGVKSRNWCNERDIKFFDKFKNPKLWFSDQKKYPAWTLRTLFSHHCDSPWGSGDCTVIQDKEEINLSALGSIIHLVQDSYSLSHTNRGKTDLSTETRCSNVQHFYSYSSQDTKKHSTADKWPIFNTSCDPASSGTLDPITASAQIIWLHAKGIKDADKVTEIISKVYGNIDESALSIPGIQYE